MSINGFVVEGFSLFTLPSLWNNHQFGYGLIYFLQNFCHLHHLTIEYKLSDAILQTIFQCMVNTYCLIISSANEDLKIFLFLSKCTQTDLRSLKIRLDASNTNFAITGRPNDSNDNSIVGYSIRRLQSKFLCLITFKRLFSFNSIATHEKLFELLTRYVLENLKSNVRVLGIKYMGHIDVIIKNKGVIWIEVLFITSSVTRFFYLVPIDQIILKS